MNATAILELLTANPAFYLATTDLGEPRVRGMLLYRADAGGILFHTGAMKEVCRQLLTDPAVELCFFDPQRMTQVRVRGTAQLVEGLARVWTMANNFAPQEPVVLGTISA
jgi:pyridoxine/pyridoxamine 5'-phosphate oxidase